MPRIMVVEDDEHLGRGLEINLKREGFDVLRVRRGDIAVGMASRTQPDLITLDVMLPGMSGLDVCRELRQRGITVPVILLTARSEEVDRVLGFELGADDYVTKPFSVRELVARIRARLRRSGSTSDAVFRSGGLEIDLDRFAVTRDGAVVSLTASEHDILRVLVRNRGEVVSRDRLLDELRGDEALRTPRTIDTHVLNLRRKLEEDPRKPRLIQSVYAGGYRFAG